MEAIKKIEVNKIAKVILIAVLGTLLLTISAKIKIPFYPVPMTMQTFIVLFLGITLGPKIGLLTVSLYLFEGIFGLPVFAGTPEKGIGLIYFTGPTMGYLFGFLVAVFIAGFLNFDKNIFLKFILITTAVSTIYIFGVPWLALLKGWQVAYVWGIKKFMLAELFKICLLTVISKQSLKLRKFI